MFCTKCGAEREEVGFCSSCGAGLSPTSTSSSAQNSPKRKSNALLIGALALVAAAGTITTLFLLMSSPNTPSADMALPTPVSETAVPEPEPEPEPEVKSYDGPTLELTNRQLRYGFEMVPSTDEVTGHVAAFRYADETDLEWWGCSSGETCGLVFVTAHSSCEVIELAYVEIKGSREWSLSVSGSTVESGFYEPGYGEALEIPLPHNGSSYVIEDSKCG